MAFTGKIIPTVADNNAVVGRISGTISYTDDTSATIISTIDIKDNVYSRGEDAVISDLVPYLRLMYAAINADITIPQGSGTGKDVSEATVEMSYQYTPGGKSISVQYTTAKQLGVTINDSDGTWAEAIASESSALEALAQGLVSTASLTGLIDFPDGGAQAADFEGSLDTGWTFVDPVGDVTLAIEDGHAKMTMPATSHDPGTTSGTPGVDSPRLERSISDTDFDIYAAFASCPFETGDVTGYGLLVFFDDGTTSRHDVFRSGSADNAYVQVRTTGTETVNIDIKGMARHLRIRRVGNDFTFFSSLTGSDWFTVSTYTTVGVVNKIAVHAFNAVASDAAHTAEIEYMHFNGDLPTVKAEPLTRTPLLTIDGSALNTSTDWDDDSEIGGTITSDGSELTLAVTSTDRSTARFASKAIQPANVGCLAKFRDPTAASNDLFFGIALRGYDDWQSQYAPKAHVF